MATEHSITKNSLFQNGDQPFTELFALLPQLQRNISGNNISYETDTPTLEAIHLHAGNAVCLLLNSIQSLGVLLATAADNKDMGLSLSEVSQIGWLVQAIGNMLSGCYVLEADVGAELARRGISILN